MRVAHISKVAGIAGSEGHLLRLLPGLVDHGLDVYFLMLQDPHRPVPAFAETLAQCGVHVETVPIRGHVDLDLGGLIAARLRAIGPTLVHTHLLHADIYGLPAARRAGIRHAISSRHNDDSFRHNPILKWINQRAMQCADQVIGISHALSRFVHEVEGIAEERIVTVHYGLEAPPLNPEARASARAELHYDDDVAVVGLFGRLIRQKGVDVLLDAYQLVLRAHSNARLLVAGDGPARSALERQARRLHLDEVVRFVGWIDGARRLMPCCDVIAVPSRWEGFGLVTLEAMSCALPIVASQVSALPEIVLDGETGLLVPPEEPRPLADALLSLFGSPARAAAMGRAGYERLVTSFSVAKMVRATIDVYERVADAGE